MDSFGGGVDTNERSSEYRAGSSKKVETNFFFVIFFTIDVVLQPDSACKISRMIGSIFERCVSTAMDRASMIVFFLEHVSKDLTNVRSSPTLDAKAMVRRMTSVPE